MLDKIKREIDKGYAKGMSIPQMAKAAGVSRNLPLMWYKGQKVPSLKNFEALKAGIRHYRPTSKKECDKALHWQNALARTKRITSAKNAKKAK